MTKRGWFTEQSAVQGPLVSYAVGEDWEELESAAALALRGHKEDELLLVDVAREELHRHNPWLSAGGLLDVVDRLRAIDFSIEGNREAHRWLLGKHSAFDETAGVERNVVLADFDDVSRNKLHVTQEWTQLAEDGTRNRADVVFLINGLPVIIVECKAAHKQNALELGITQVARYHRETPGMMAIAQLFGITHLIDLYYGVTWNPSRRTVARWKVAQDPTFEHRVRTFFKPSRVLGSLRDELMFVEKEGGLDKVLHRQHQSRAVAKTVERALDPAKRRGLIWHTQGSGKTLTMISSAIRLLTRTPGSKPLVLMLIDRNELEGQLVANLLEHGLDSVEIADSKVALRRLLRSHYRGLVVSMLHKFEGIEANVDLGTDVVVLVDEAHRSTSSTLGNYLMGALPNATFIGFTGTPIDRTAHGRGTFVTFGGDDEDGYLDKYSIKDSIEDRTTLPLNYALAPNNMIVPRDRLEEEFLNLAESEGVTDVQELNKVLDKAVNLKSFLKSDQRVELVAEFVAKHFVESVRPLGFKAFLVGVDREACVLLKSALDRVFPADRSAVVITGAHNDSEDLRAHHLSDAQERAIRKQFLAGDSNLEILIVTEKLLTGFDAPALYCMYLDKPMRDHVLLQAIARVNRPMQRAAEDDKKCGLVIDFVGIFERLEKALSFDADTVEAAIQDLEVLKERFAVLMSEAGTYTELFSEVADDKALELILSRFIEPDERATFEEYFDELERLYEILSPDSFLRPFLDDYALLARLKALLASAFSSSVAVARELAAKTELLVRSEIGAGGLDSLTKLQPITPATLDQLREDDSEVSTVINLAKSLSTATSDSSQSALRSIDVRVQDVLSRFTDRQVDTQSALETLEQLMREYLATKEAQEASGLDDREFALSRVLMAKALPDEATLRSVLAAADELPAHREQPDQRRELRLRLYGLFMDAVEETEIASLIDELLRAGL